MAFVTTLPSHNDNKQRTRRPAHSVQSYLNQPHFVPLMTRQHTHFPLLYLDTFPECIDRFSGEDLEKVIAKGI